MKIVDNFLHEKDFNYLKDYVLGRHIGWFYKDDTSKTGDPFWHHTSHIIHRRKRIFNEGMYPVESFCRKLGIDPISKRRELTGTGGYAHDFPLISEITAYAWPRISGINRNTGKSLAYDRDQKNPYSKTAFLYINTNNGSTIFKKPGLQLDEKIKCVANRLVIFNSTDPFYQVSCSNAKRSLVLKVNYLENKDGDKIANLSEDDYSLKQP
tara:strand:+ start:431 stop:1060 length:630 start_codon:yes stop_codon:yes gene_type:complete